VLYNAMKSKRPVVIVSRGRRGARKERRRSDEERAATERRGKSGDCAANERAERSQRGMAGSERAFRERLAQN